MYDGYIKLFRKSLESRVFANDALWKVWCYCLLKANHKEQWVSVQTGSGETEVKVNPGQFIWGSKKAGKELRMKWRSAYNRLKKLETMQNLTTHNATHFTIVTINNWETYQSNNIESGKADGKPVVTNKNDKNEKNDKKDTTLVIFNKNDSADFRDKFQKAFRYWNSKQIIVHRKPDKGMVLEYRKWYVQGINIKESIAAYSAVLKVEYTRWTYKWGFEEFLKRGVKKFRDLTPEEAINNYRKNYE